MINIGPTPRRPRNGLMKRVLELPSSVWGRKTINVTTCICEDAINLRYATMHREYYAQKLSRTKINASTFVGDDIEYLQKAAMHPERFV